MLRAIPVYVGYVYVFVDSAVCRQICVVNCQCFSRTIYNIVILCYGLNGKKTVILNQRLYRP